MEKREIEHEETFRKFDYDTIEQAQFKINAVTKEYGGHPDWEVGKSKIKEQPDGRYMVEIQLKKYEPKGYSR